MRIKILGDDPNVNSGIVVQIVPGMNVFNYF